MPKSADVSAGDEALASDYNNLRDDALRQIAISGGTKTISSGAITLTPDSGEGLYIVASESGTEDTLDSMSGGESGDIVILKADTGDTITIADGSTTNEFILDNDLELTGELMLAFRFDGTSWYPVGDARGNEKHVSINAFQDNVSISTGNGVVPILIPYQMNGWKIVDVLGSVDAQGSSGTTDIQIRRVRSGSATDVLSTKVTIGAEYYARDGVINTSNNTVQTGDKIYIDVDAARTGAEGLTVTITLRTP